MKAMRLCWPGYRAIRKKIRNAHTILERKILEGKKIMWKTG
jgi:hypothetical protein